MDELNFQTERRVTPLHLLQQRMQSSPLTELATVVSCMWTQRLTCLLSQQ